MTTTEARNKIAQQHLFDTWAEMDQAMSFPENQNHPLNDYERWQELEVEATKLYASEKVKEALQLAAERATLAIERDGEQLSVKQLAYFAKEMDHVEVYKAGILNLETELLKQINKEI